MIKPITMKLNWGHKLILVFIAFGCMMSYLVYRSIKTSNDLVSNEYYKDELVYQQVIDDAQRASQLSEKISITQNNAAVVIHFPHEMNDAGVKGYAWFYCAADARKDIRIPLAVSTGGTQETESGRFIPGRYIVKINWSSGGKNYYSEQPLSIH
jgi:hypothetical protein